MLGAMGEVSSNQARSRQSKLLIVNRVTGQTGLACDRQVTVDPLASRPNRIPRDCMISLCLPCTLYSMKMTALIGGLVARES